MTRSPKLRLAEVFLVAALLATHVWLSVSSSAEKSIAFDETAHIGGGLMAWEGDFRFNAESGILPQRWAGLPSLWTDVKRPGPDHPARQQGNVWVVGREILYGPGNDSKAIAQSARTMIALASLALGACVYLWSRSLFGPAGALLSLILYAASPTMLAHSRLVTSDLLTALFFLLATSALWWLLDGWTTGHDVPRRAFVAGLATAGLLLSKHSGLLIVPMAVVLVAVAFFGRRQQSIGRQTTDRRQMLTAVAILALTIYGTIWAAYGFRFAAGETEEATFVHSWEAVLDRGGPAALGVAVARELRILPEAYLWGLAYTFDTTRERDAFLRGQTSTTGWWWFFPYAVAIKTPLAFFAVLILAAVAAARGPREELLDGLWKTAPLWVLLAVYWLVAVTSPLNIGHRHMLPIYPVMFILAGAAAGLAARHRLAAGTVAILAGLFLWESVHIRPHYLAYFNQLAGGPQNGYRHLVDSSLDWGQDLPALRRWLEDFRQDEPSTRVYVSYLGTAVPDLADLDVAWLFSYFPVADYVRPPEPLTAGVYCVSATLLQSVHMETLGPWTAEREAAYRDRRQAVRHFIERFQTTEGRTALAQERPVGEWMGLLRDFDRLRSARLFRDLRTREPDARAGWSINIYRLSEEDVAAATLGEAHAKNVQ